MITLAIALFVLASTMAFFTLLLLMKTSELIAAVTDLANATTGLATSVDAAVAILINQGQPSTPDADIVPLITAIEVETERVKNLNAKLVAATTPPQP